MEEKTLTRQRVDMDLATKLRPAGRTARERFILACRILGDQGHWYGGLAGQITMRGARDNTFLTLKFGIGADEAVMSDLILFDDKLNTRDGEGLPNPAVRFHLWVYRVRPDVQCIVHTHPPSISALSMTGRALKAAHMDATPFHENCGHLSDWPGLPIGDSEGEVIAGALGPRRKALLLAHHGLLTAGASIEEAAVLATWMEHAAQAQLRAEATGTIQDVRPELAAESRDFLLKPPIVNLTFEYFARRVLRADPDCLSAHPA